MNRKRILIIDDQTLFSQTLQRTLQDEGSYVVEFAATSTRRHILERIRSFVPSVVLLDIHLGGLNGLDVAEELLASFPRIIVLMLTAFGYPDYVDRARRAGTSGILLKDMSIGELVGAIDAASKHTFIEPQRKQPEHRGSRDDTPEWFGYLTDSEKRILRLVVQGYANDEIADRLNLGRQTVKNYVSGLYKKMDVTNRFHAIRTAIEDYPEHFSQRY